MATKSAQLLLEVKAETDQAKRALTEIDKAAAPLEKGITVPVKATGGDQAATQLESVAKTAKQLEKGISVAVKATGGDQAAAQLEAIAKAGKEAGVMVNGINAGHVRDVEGPARIAAAALGEVETAAERADRALQDIDPPANVDVPLQRTSEQLKTTERAADGTKNAFANLVGNSAQDLGNMLGPLGSVGVAIGQVAEYTADAANEGGGLVSALSGAAKAVGPIALLSGAMLVVTKVMEDAKAKAAAQEKAVQDLADAFIDGTGVLTNWSDALAEGFSDGTLNNVELLNKFVSKGLGEENFKKSAVALGQMDKSLNDLGPTLLSADQDFESMARNMAVSAGMTDRQAEAFARLINQQSDLSDVMRILEAPKVKGGPWEALEGIDVGKFKGLASGLAEINDQVDRGNTGKAATQFLDAARAVEEFRGVVDEARASGLSEADAAVKVAGAMEAQKTARDANTRAAEEGARAAQESGTILDQVGRDVANASDLASAAMDKAKKAQDDWLLKNVDTQAAADDLTESIYALVEGTTKQAEAGVEGAGSFEGNTKAALDNRDALGEVYGKALDVIQGMQDAGLSVDDARQKQNDMAQSAYDLAVSLGFPVSKAEEIRDKINQIPPSVTSEVKVTETGYEERLAEMERLERDIHNTVYFAGVVDRNLQSYINSGIFAGAQSLPVPPGTSVAPSAGAQAVVVPVAAPAASAAPAGSRAATVTQPVVINVNAGIVADTFQLQRAVTRSARSFQRLAGKRAA